MTNFTFHVMLKKNNKKKVFEEKLATLGKNDVIEKLLMSSNFFLHQRVH